MAVFKIDVYDLDYQFYVDCENEEEASVVAFGHIKKIGTKFLPDEPLMLSESKDGDSEFYLMNESEKIFCTFSLEKLNILR